MIDLVRASKCPRLVSRVPARIILAAVACVLFFSSPSTAQTFTRIDFPGALQTVPNGINARGDIVGEYLDGNLDGHGFLLRNGIYTTIDVPGAIRTGVAAINASGDVVGYFIDSAGQHGFVLRKGEITIVE